VEGVVPATELAKEPSIDTLIGLPLVVRTEADRLLVGAAVVSESNISARNGIIHPVDRVLKPPRNVKPGRKGRGQKRPRRTQPDQWWW